MTSEITDLLVFIIVKHLIKIILTSILAGILYPKWNGFLISYLIYIRFLNVLLSATR